MHLSDNIFQPEKYTYSDYKLWAGDWELINGYPFAMSPSPKRKHQLFSANFVRYIGNELAKNEGSCNCKVFSELDWIINDTTVVRPDVMIVCGEFQDDYLNFPPSLILEISSHATRLRDRNTKYKLYAMCGVKYYLIADTDKKIIEVFELWNNGYKQSNLSSFVLNDICKIEANVFNLWE